MLVLLPASGFFGLWRISQLPDPLCFGIFSKAAFFVSYKNDEFGLRERALIQPLKKPNESYIQLSILSSGWNLQVNSNFIILLTLSLFGLLSFTVWTPK